jgi:ATP-binding cassette subfamily F protein uup
VATDLLVFEQDAAVIHYVGNYSTYRALRAQREEAEREAQAHQEMAEKQKARALKPQKPRQPRALTYAERLELERVEEHIELADARIAELEAQLCDPHIYQQDHQQAAALSTALQEAKREAARLMARWEELESKKQSGGDA